MPFGNELKSSNPNVNSPTQFLPDEYVVGRQWTTQFQVANLRTGTKDEADVHLEVAARATITVPAGMFDTFRMERRGGTVHDGAALHHILWVALSVRRPTAAENAIRNRKGEALVSERIELISNKQTA